MTITTIIAIINGWLDQVIRFHFYSYWISIIVPSYLYDAGLLICNITYLGQDDTSLILVTPISDVKAIYRWWCWGKMKKRKGSLANFLSTWLICHRWQTAQLSLKLMSFQFCTPHQQHDAKWPPDHRVYLGCQSRHRFQMHTLCPLLMRG